MNRTAARIGLLILGLAIAIPAAAEVPEPSGYREDQYRASEELMQA